MKVQVRFAQSGHSHIFSDQLSVQGLMISIKEQFKVQLKDQKLISKSGLLLKQNDGLDSVGGLMQMTYLAEQGDNKQKMSRISTVFVFDNDSLLMNKCQQKQPNQQECLNSLQTRFQYLNQIKKSIYQLKPLPQVHEKIMIANPQLQQLRQFYKAIDGGYREMDSLVMQFAIIKCCTEEVTQLCDNQRKSIKALDKVLSNMITFNLNKKVQDILIKLETLSKKFQQKNQTQKEFLSKTILKQLLQTKENIQEKVVEESQRLKQQTEFNKIISSKVKEDKKNIVQKFKLLDQILKQTDNKSTNTAKQVEHIMNTIKSKYQQIMQSISKSLLSQQQQEIDDILLNAQTEVQFIKQNAINLKQYIRQEKNNYCKIYKQNKNNQFEVRSFYQKFHNQYQIKILRAQQNLKQSQKAVHNLNRQVDNYLNSKYLQIISQLQNQLKRRFIFYKSIANWQQKINLLLKQQYQKRKQFQMLNITTISELKNAQVPTFKIIHQKTTDNQLQSFLITQKIEMTQQLYYLSHSLRESLQKNDQKQQQTKQEYAQQLERLKCFKIFRSHQRIIKIVIQQQKIVNQGKKYEEFIGIVFQSVL